MNTTVIRIQLVPTLEDYFQLGLLYMNIASQCELAKLHHQAEYLKHAIIIFENIYGDSLYNRQEKM